MHDFCQNFQGNRFFIGVFTIMYMAAWDSEKRNPINIDEKEAA